MPTGAEEKTPIVPSSAMSKATENGRAKTSEATTGSSGAFVLVYILNLKAAINARTYSTRMLSTPKILPCKKVLASLNS